MLFLFCSPIFTFLLPSSISLSLKKNENKYAGPIVIPLKSITTFSKICSDQKFKTITCHIGPYTKYSFTVEIGSTGAGQLFQFLLAVDSGSSRTWVWTQKTVFVEIDELGNETKVSPDHFYSGNSELPKYNLPLVSSKVARDHFGLGQKQSVKLSYYKDQVIHIPDGPMLDFHVGIVTQFKSEKMRKRNTQGTLGLGLSVTKDPENKFMDQFMKQKSPDLKSIVAIDINVVDGKYETSQISIGKSLRELSSSAVHVPVDDQHGQINKKWLITADSWTITFPRKDPWTVRNIQGFLDTGGPRLTIPRQYFDQIKKENKVEYPEVYQQRILIQCKDINYYLPKVEIGFCDKKANRSVVITIDGGKFFEVFEDPNTNQEHCTILLQILTMGNSDMFIFGVPLFAASYIELNFETEQVVIDKK